MSDKDAKPPSTYVYSLTNDHAMDQAHRVASLGYGAAKVFRLENPWTENPWTSFPLTVSHVASMHR